MINRKSLEKLINFFSKSEALTFKKREIILHVGQRIESVFLIKSGFMRIYRLSEQGEELTLNILKEGDIFPVDWNLKDSINRYYFEAVTLVEIWRVPLGNFYNFTVENPDVLNDLARFAFERYENLLNRIEYMAMGPAYRKVAATIFDFAKNFGQKNGDEVVMGLQFTHRDIAALVGITRETTCLEMKKLEKKGLISQKGRKLVVKNIEGLETESQIFSF